MKTVVCDPAYPELRGDVSLDVVVGEGHKGGIVVYLDGAEVASGSDTLEGVELGSAGSLLGRTLQVVTTVRPLGPSRRASVTCVFRSDAPDGTEGCSVEEHDDELHLFRVTFAGSGEDEEGRADGGGSDGGGGGAPEAGGGASDG